MRFGAASNSTSTPGCPRLRHVEDDARRARAGGDGRLQVVDVHVEPGHVERAVAVQHSRLDADLVVPDRLVRPGLAAAERDEVLRRAQRHVERIVDAAEPEPARDLRVQVGVVRQLVGGDEARRDAVGVGRAGLRHERRAGVVVGEDAVEDLLLVLAEVVVAQAAGQAELRR